jgi:hypothetical protein
VNELPLKLLHTSLLIKDFRLIHRLFVSDPASELRGEMYAKFYIPRDERVTLVQTEGLEQEDAIEVASRKMMPALFALYSTQEEYQSLDQVFDLFRKGVTLSTDSKCASDCEPGSEAEAESVVTFRRPKVIASTFVQFSNMIAAAGV